MRTGRDTPTDDKDKEKEITSTIEEIIPDDTTTASAAWEEQNIVVVDDSNDRLCPNCGFNTVVRLLGCHTMCSNCGSGRTCSDI